MQILLSVGFASVTMFAYAQETNADVSYEVNEDAFQESFYESLKQKGIENYDKAITALLTCKSLEPDNVLVDYEIGLNYMYQHKYVEAQPYLEKAITEEPINKWYLDALLSCYKNQQQTEKAIEVATQLAQKNTSYALVVADLYFDERNYKKAIEVLDELEAKGLYKAEVAQRKSKAVMLNNITNLANTYAEETPVSEEKSLANNPIEDYKKQILKQQSQTNYKEMLAVSSEALDNYPTQPEFYYLKGVALNKLQNFELATEVLEEGLGYLLDDATLENNIYKELVFAYKGANNLDKAKQYQQKIDASN